ncbi:MAG: site-specific DNA-methyltransferase [Selenomonadaceae bacterium]|nr:site-specific DNA-methyltransferase [Selenomonadaceae bacterium]
MCRIIKDDGAVFYNNKNRVQNGLIEDRREILNGFPLRQIITWKRSGAINFNPGYFLPTTEQIYLLCNKAFKLAKGANKNTDVWQVKQEMNNPHPAPFPEELINIIVSSTTGKIILDPFAGSGTTAVSSKNFGRDFILIEKSLRYCKIAQARIDGKEDWRNG